MHGNLEDSRASRVRHSNALYNTLEATLTTSFRIQRDGPQFYYFDANGPARNVFLPPIEPGGGQFYIIGNTGATGNINVLDAAGATQRTLVPGANAIINSSKTKWYTAPLSATGAGGAGVSTSGAVDNTKLAGFADSTGLLIRAITVGAGLLLSGTTLSVPAIADGDKGDITTSSSSTIWTIDPQAVTYSKIQNISTTGRVLARVSAGPGSVEEATISQLLDFIGSAAQGDILYRGSTSWTRLPAGTAGQVLTTSGPGFNVNWSTPLPPAGMGNVSTSGTPVAGQFAQFTDANHITGVTSPGGGDVFLANANQFTNSNFFPQSAGIVTGSTTAVTGRTDSVQINMTTASAALSIWKWSSDGVQANLGFFKSRGSAVSSFATTQSGDILGMIGFNGTNTTPSIGTGAQFRGVQTGAATSVIPTALTFYTTKDVTEGLQRRGAITQSGAWIIGDRDTPVETSSVFEVHNQNNTGSDARRTIYFSTWANAAQSINLNFAKSKSGVIGTHAAVVSNDNLGVISFLGSDGTGFQFGAQIVAAVNGTVSAACVPTELRFSTTPVGGVNTIRLTIGSDGTSTFANDVVMPTQAATDNSTKGATTAFVASVARDTFGVRGFTGITNANVLIVTFIEARLRDANGAGVLRTSGSFTIDQTLGIGVVNGRDAALSDGDVHFYAIWNGATLGGICSMVAPPTGPTLPSGYTHWCYLTTIKRAGGSFALVYARGSKVTLIGPSQIATAVTSAAWASVSSAGAVPAIALTTNVWVRASCVAGTGNIINHNVSHASGNSRMSFYVSSVSGNTNWIASEGWLPNVSQLVWYISGTLVGSPTGAIDIAINGYEVPNGD